MLCIIYHPSSKLPSPSPDFCRSRQLVEKLRYPISCHTTGFSKLRWHNQKEQVHTLHRKQEQKNTCHLARQLRQFPDESSWFQSWLVCFCFLLMSILEGWREWLQHGGPCHTHVRLRWSLSLQASVWLTLGFCGHSGSEWLDRSACRCTCSAF